MLENQNFFLFLCTAMPVYTVLSSSSAAKVSFRIGRPWVPIRHRIRQKDADPKDTDQPPGFISLKKIAEEQFTNVVPDNTNNKSTK
jgi:hypothetical protein